MKKAKQVTGKLKRDAVISIVKNKCLVGVYWEKTNGKDILFETSPEKADAFIKIFNSPNPPENYYRRIAKSLADLAQEMLCISEIGEFEALDGDSTEEISVMFRESLDKLNGND